MRFVEKTMLQFHLRTNICYQILLSKTSFSEIELNMLQLINNIKVAHYMSPTASQIRLFHGFINKEPCNIIHYIINIIRYCFSLHRLT